MADLTDIFDRKCDEGGAEPFPCDEEDDGALSVSLTLDSIAIAADTERCDQVGTPLSSWAAERWTDLALAVAWLLDHGVGTAAQQASLFELGRTLHEQGTDWERCFRANFTGCPGGELGPPNDSQRRLPTVSRPFRDRFATVSRPRLSVFPRAQDRGTMSTWRRPSRAPGSGGGSAATRRCERCRPIGWRGSTSTLGCRRACSTVTSCCRTRRPATRPGPI